MHSAISSLAPLFGRFIHQSPHGLPIGREGTIRVSYFLDLLSACHVTAHRDVIVTSFSDWLTQQVFPDSIDVVVGPKRGNTIFSKAVADKLGKRSAFARENILFGRWVEGVIRPEDRVLLIDDVASEGEMLLDAVESLRNVGIAVDQAYVLVDRPEGDARKHFENAGIRYSCAVSLSDMDLAALLSNARDAER